MVGLWADVTGGRKRPRPIVRVEYDRRQSGRGRSAAHVHLHANSPELAWMYGSAGRPAPDLHALHFPVGGRRFRPTLEEFLLFLDRENLFNDWKEGWKPRLIRSLEAWERRQARATARQFPDEAIGALEGTRLRRHARERVGESLGGSWRERADMNESPTRWPE